MKSKVNEQRSFLIALLLALIIVMQLILIYKMYITGYYLHNIKQRKGHDNCRYFNCV